MSAVIQSDSGGYDVHHGFWINWSYGKINGATVTLSRQSGGLLIAFLALYVSAVGKSFWRVGCFMLHAYFSKEGPQDGLYHQRQAILRNTESAPEGAWTLLSAALAWRKRARLTYRRIFPTSILAILIACSFTIAGIFSSRVTTNNANEVLLAGKNCGIFIQVPLNPSVFYGTIGKYLAQRSTEYLTYSSQCYTNKNAARSENCRPYVKPRLSYSIIKNASCPFAKDVCLTESKNLILDTGYLNSHDDFGINEPTEKRFAFRNVIQCSPLVTEGFSKLHTNKKQPSIQVMRYYYSQTSDNILATPRDTSFTFQVPVNFSTTSLDNFTSIQSITPDYSVGAVQTPYFDPIPQLNRTDAVLWLLFLSAPGVAYANPTDDPWFSAHTASKSKWTDPADGSTRPLLIRDDPANVLGCTTQVQFCNRTSPQPSDCEPLGPGHSSLKSSMSKLWSHPDDQSSMEWAKNALVNSTAPSIGDFYVGSGESSLMARTSMFSGLQLGTIEPDQWQKEIEHLFQAQLAAFQDTFVLAANGPYDKDMEANLKRPNSTAQHAKCTNQKIFSALYYSFNVLGLAIIIGLGGSIIMLDLCLEPYIFGCIQRLRRRPQHPYSRLEWSTNATLQLQRLAHEELGLGTWSRCDKAIPVTQSDEILGLLDIEDKAHPRLIRPSGMDVGGRLDSAATHAEAAKELDKAADIAHRELET